MTRHVTVCEVGLNTPECESPPGGEFASIRTRCFACGQPACKNCSRIRRWLSFGKRRVCRDCEEQEKMPRETPPPEPPKHAPTVIYRVGAGGKLWRYTEQGEQWATQTWTGEEWQDRAPVSKNAMRLYMTHPIKRQETFSESNKGSAVLLARTRLNQEITQAKAAVERAESYYGSLGSAVR